MARNKTPTFITRIPLQATPGDERTLLKRLEAARQVYNACLGESLKRLELLRQSKLYQAAKKLPKGPKGSPQAKARAAAFRKANAAVGFREYDLHGYATQFNHCWIGDHLDANTIQTVATRAFGAVRAYALGKKGRPRFKGKDQFDSVEGKTNRQGIRWRGDHVEWLGLTLPAIIDPDDPIIAHGLNSPHQVCPVGAAQDQGQKPLLCPAGQRGVPLSKAREQAWPGGISACADVRKRTSLQYATRCCCAQAAGRAVGKPAKVSDLLWLGSSKFAKGEERTGCAERKIHGRQALDLCLGLAALTRLKLAGQDPLRDQRR